jgi:3-methyladenine DNA glycosylase AlkD
MKYQEIMKGLKSLSNPKIVEGMSRFGIKGETMYGVSIPNLRTMAKKIGKDHSLALELWKSGIHEAKILASMIDDPQLVTEKQMEEWVKTFDSWDVCDQTCMNLFDKTDFVYKKISEWNSRKEEFVKRTAFTLMACLAFHNKKAADQDFVKFFPIIKREATDDRIYVKKAVNWALRQIGKRNKNLNKLAIENAYEIKKIESKSAKWIASDALRELTSKAVQKRLINKN